MAELFDMGGFLSYRPRCPVEIVVAGDLEGLPEHKRPSDLMLFADHGLRLPEDPHVLDGTRELTEQELRDECCDLAEHPVLFREFAALDPTPLAFPAFAERYGLLYDLDADEGRYFQCRLKGRDGSYGVAEPVDDWLCAHRMFAHATRLWTAIEDKDVEVLRGLIHWSKRGLEYNTIDPSVNPEFSGWVPHQTFPDIGISRRDDLAVGKWVVVHIIGSIMQSMGRYYPDLKLANGMQAQVSVCPYNLVGAMAMQFALAFAGNKEFRQCQTCGRWFEIHPDVGRPSKQFCGTPCRMKSYRMRQQEAKRLSAEGRSVEQIANELGTSVDTAEFWIQKTRQQRSRESLKRGVKK